MEETIRAEAESLRSRLANLKAKYNGALRINKSDRALLEDVASFRKRSGLNSARCAEILQIRTHQLGYLLVRAYRERKKRQSEKTKPIKLRRIQLPEESTASPVEISLPNGIKAKFQSVKASMEFVRSL